MASYEDREAIIVREAADLSQSIHVALVGNICLSRVQLPSLVARREAPASLEFL